MGMSDSRTKMLKTRHSPLHMGHHERPPVKPCRSRVVGIELHSGKPPPQVIRISIDGLRDRRRVGGLWELESGRGSEDRRRIDYWARPRQRRRHLILPNCRAFCMCSLASTIAVGLLSDTVMLRFDWHKDQTFGRRTNCHLDCCAV